MKKALAIMSICLIGILLIGGLFYFKPSKTLDFRGTVTEIKKDNDTYTFYIEQPSLSVKYTVVADIKTKVKPLLKNAKPISITDIKVGDTIEGDYKKWFAKENKAKYITVYTVYYEPSTNEMEALK